MIDNMIDILFITYNRPRYTERTLPALLSSCDEAMRVWIWHNGSDSETLNVVRSYRHDKRVFKFMHSVENKKIREPTNWFWQNSDAPLVAKVDDDLILPSNWGSRMRKAHAEEPRLGVIGAWPFMKQDIIERLVARKLIACGDSTRIMQHHFVGGGGYVMKREVIDDIGLMDTNQSFTSWCGNASSKGWINGWLYPFIWMDNFDDPRHPECQIKTEEDFKKMKSLSSQVHNVPSLRMSKARQRPLALQIQRSSHRAATRPGWIRKVTRKIDRIRMDIEIWYGMLRNT